jgi:hypothetical protein
MRRYTEQRTRFVEEGEVRRAGIKSMFSNVDDYAVVRGLPEGGGPFKKRAE